MIYNPLRTLASIASHPSNRNNRVGAIVRYLKWQLSSRLLGFKQVMPWIEDSKLFISPGEAMITHNLYTGIYEYYDMSFLLDTTTMQDSFLDVGANAGVYTVLCGAVLNVEVLAFEPIPNTYARLLENIHLNHLDNSVKAINKGLSDKSGTLNFVADQDATNHVSTDPSDASIEIPVVRLDDELEEMDFTPTIMKLDVEGFEYFVLKGADKLLSNPKLNVIIIELNQSGHRFDIDDSDVSNLITGYGFRAYDYYPDSRTIVPLDKDISQRQNTLFIRNLSLVSNKPIPNKTFVIHNR